MSTAEGGLGPTGSSAGRMSDAMPQFRGVDHFSLTVTDLDASERFYTQVLGFVVVLDFGYGRLVIHKPTGFHHRRHAAPGWHGRTVQRTADRA